jgi:hypothetical protein
MFKRRADFFNHFTDPFAHSATILKGAVVPPSSLGELGYMTRPGTLSVPRRSVSPGLPLSFPSGEHREQNTAFNSRGHGSRSPRGATNVKPRTRWPFASAPAPTLKARVPPAGCPLHNVEAGIESLKVRLTRVFASAIAARPLIPSISRTTFWHGRHYPWI